MAITSYQEFKDYLNDILTTNISTSSGETELKDTEDNSPHGAFWNSMSYDQFVDGDVPGVTDPDTGQGMKILVKGSSAQSNFILSLRGTPGSAFDPDVGAFGQMPADGPPMLTAEQILPIAEWIDNHCPQ